MIWAAVEKQYDGSIFYLLLFIINVFGLYATKNEAEPNKVTVLKKHFDDAHHMLKIQRDCRLDDEYMKGMYNGMELILSTIEDREPIWASELDTYQKEEAAMPNLANIDNSTEDQEQSND